MNPSPAPPVAPGGLRGSGRADPREQALATMWANYAGAVRAYALRLTGDRSGADDVVQETFLRAWNNLHRLDPDRSPLPWLLVVARNVAFGMGRRRSVRVAETQLADWSLGETVDARTGDSIDRLLDDVVVGEALGRISAEHRGALEAVFLRGLSVAEAADALGVPPGTVKSRTYYGLRALRLVLEELGLRS